MMESVMLEGRNLSQEIRGQPPTPLSKTLCMYEKKGIETLMFMSVDSLPQA